MQNDYLLTIHFNEKRTFVTPSSLKEKFGWLDELDRPLIFKANKTLNTIEAISFFYTNRISFCPLATDSNSKNFREIHNSIGGTHICLERKKIIEKRKSSFSSSQKYLILQTSGSSTKPKLCLLSFDSLKTSSKMVVEYFKLKNGDCWEINLPLNHIAGLMGIFRMLAVQGQVSLLDTKDAISSKSTYISLVPTLLQRLLVNHKKRLKEFKAIMLGGTKIQAELINQSIEYNLPLYISYGMTEACSTICLGKYKIGNPLPEFELKIDEENQILIKGPSLFDGYYVNGKIEDPKDENGYFSTRDLGEIKKDGLKLLGRKDRMIISGGENIQPEEIEEVLTHLFQLNRCKVVGIPCLEYGQRLLAYIDPVVNLTMDEMRQILKNHLPNYKIPSKFEEMKEKTWKN